MVPWRQHRPKPQNKQKVTKKADYRVSFVKHNRTNMTNAMLHCQKLNWTGFFQQ